MNGGELSASTRLSRALLALVILLIFFGLAFAVLSLPPGARGLGDRVDAALVATGVGNPVTATLLYFRGYDTLLELAVLLLALIAIRGIGHADSSPQPPGSEILAVLAGLQAPTMILLAGYLLWSGADATGGAFQAGAVLAAAGVLLILAGIQLPQRPEGLPFRVGLAAGLTVFVGLGVAGVLASGAFLDYPRLGGDAVTLVLEGSATVSIGLVLLEMFHSVLSGCRPRGAASPTTGEKR